MENIEKSLEKPHVQPWLKEGIILIVEAGSHAYGTNTEESDKDYKGVVIPPLEYHIGLQTFEHFVAEGSNTRKNTANDVDITLYALKKFVKLGLNSNPHVIEMLFADEDSILFKNDLGQQLLDNRHLFVSNRILKSFGGYALSNLRRIEKDADKKELKEDSFAYDTKTAAHSVRLYQMGIELLETGTTTTKRPNASELLDIRGGKYPYGEMMAMLRNMDKELYEIKEQSVLRDKPNQKELEELLMKLTLQYLG